MITSITLHQSHWFLLPKAFAPLLPSLPEIRKRGNRTFQKCQEYTTEIGSDKKVEVIPNPVELDAFSPQTSTPEQREEIRKTFGIPLDATVACFVGRLGQEKSVDVLLNSGQKK